MSIWFISEGFDLKYFKSTARILCLNVVNENILFTKIDKLRGFMINNNNIYYM